MMSVFANAQIQRATITLNDGTVKNGLARIRDLRLDIKFKAKKEAKKEFFDFKEIRSISIVEVGKVITYEVKYKTKKTAPIVNETKKKDDYDDDDDEWEENDVYESVRMPYLFEVVVKGDVSLYTFSTMTGSNGMMGGGGSITTYYLSKGNDDYVTTIAYFGSLNVGKSFKKKAIKYFSDCPNLVQKIKDKVYKKRDIKEIVEYYNSNCGQ